MFSIAIVHPMLVHFPIVLLITAVAMDIVVLLTRKDSASRQCLSLIALSALLLGTLSAGVAAIFGDIALDKAISLGFPPGPLETHETLALITIAVFSLHCLLRLLAVWRKYPLRGLSGWVSILPGLAGVVLLIITAYYGGELVYHLGVNVAAVTP
ncbi:MAG: hypothetical protein PVG35_00715 [Desulfobacterales bacterium]|jgi:uncharacterized membrane protein